MLNLSTYGAGLGAANDGPAIQAALDDAEEQGIEEVYGPYTPLGYALQQYLLHPSNITLRFDRRARIYRNTLGISNLIRGKTTGAGYTGLQNVRLIGGLWDGFCESFDHDSNLITYGHAEGVWIEGVRVRSAKTHHIEINACRNVRIRNVQFLDWAGAVREALQLDAAVGSFVGDFAPFDGTACEDVVVEGCTFRGNISRAIGSHTDSQGHRDIRILNNYVESPSDVAFNLLDYIDVVAIGNRVKGGTKALELRNCDRALVAGNHFTDQTVACITIDQDSVGVHVSTVTNVFTPASGAVAIIDNGVSTVTDGGSAPPPPPPSTVTPLVLVNPDADQGVTGWTNTHGALGTRTTPAPPWGGPFFWGNQNVLTRAYQEVEIPVELHESVDAGVATIVASGWQGSYPSAGDPGQLLVQALVVVGGALVGTEYQTTLQTAPTTWKAVSVEGALPAGARAVRLTMRMTRTSGTNNDCYFDDLALAIRTPAD